MTDSPDATAGPPVDELRAAVQALHARIDRLASTVEGVLDDAAGDLELAVEDPRLEDAQDGFHHALHVFHRATGDMFGADDEDVEEDDSDVDAFFLHFEVAVPDGTPPERLDAVYDIVRESGERVAARIRAEGLDVEHWVSRSELAPEDEDDL